MTTPCHRKFVAAVIGFLSSFSLALAAPVKFEIPAQPLPTALKIFVKQSSVQVVFNPDELQGVNANAVKGEFEPADALDALLKGTGVAASKGQGGIFVVKKKGLQATGSVRGSLRGEGGKVLPDVLIAIRETGQSTSTDRDGVYSFPAVAPGTYMLVATAAGYQPLHITDVEVRANRDLTLSREDMRKALGDVTSLDPFVVHADAVTELEKYLVEGQREKPFTGANVDIPRTVDDVQPYYTFDAKVIDQSGAVNVEDFLKQRLAMNTATLSNGQTLNDSEGGNQGYVLGNTSSINLRGLGADKTLILVNGRRMAGVTIGTTDYQPDLNGIPLSAIDRIEVLPSSASGIYGGSAVGGVVNIILKRDYVGGEIRATYDNTWNTDSPRRTLSASYGTALEGGRTHVTLNASWSDASPLLFQDRRAILDANLATILQNSPSYVYSATTPWLGSLPNITPTSSSATTLTLKNGTALNSRNTHIAAGTSASTSTADLYATLLANAGSWNFDLPATTQSPTGLLRPFGVTPETKSFRASVRRQMFSMLECFADFSYDNNHSESLTNPFSGSFSVRSSAPTNPFNQNVYVKAPSGLDVPVTSDSVARAVTVGAIAKLPGDWTAEFDYTHSESRYHFLTNTTDFNGVTADLASGVLNPFVDTLLHPLNLGKYLVSQSYGGSSTLDDFALRGSGSVRSLPWGVPMLTFGLEHRTAKTPENTYGTDFPLTPASSYDYTYYARQQTTDSGYVETTVPLVKKDWLPLIHAFDLQASARSERYSVDTGTTGQYTYYGRTPVEVVYGSPTLNALPYFSKDTYGSTNYTIGFKYQPVPELTLRASLATAFLPPAPAQLVKNPLIDPYPSTVSDPKTASFVDVSTISGGNSDLKPQNSKSWNAGLIWEPRWSRLKGLRLDAEYYRIEQNNYIDSLDAQTIVNLESTYPSRVTRDASGTITLVDISAINLYRRETEGWDLSADYTFKTGIGTFNLMAVESIILHLKNQYALTVPEYDAAGYHPSEGGAAKYKSNATLTWERGGWTAGWTVRYFSSYKQYGAAGGPAYSQYYESYGADLYYAIFGSYLVAQGSDTIPSQTYHDLFVGYAFGKQSSGPASRPARVGRGILDNLSMQFGVRNVFNKVPPMDVFYSSTYYASPYGDTRLRSYWVSIKKQF